MMDENLLNFRRAVVLDAYRKYQSAVNYGEFNRDEAVDDYIALVYAKDENAIMNPCVQLLYFMGEVPFAASNLTKPA